MSFIMGVGNYVGKSELYPSPTDSGYSDVKEQEVKSNK